MIDCDRPPLEPESNSPGARCRLLGAWRYLARVSIAILVWLYILGALSKLRVILRAG